MIKININNNTYEIKSNKDRNLLETCLALGFDVPYFCYHPALGSVGACRMCAVKKFKDAYDKKGKIIMSCMESVVDGMIISTDDDEVIEFRKSIIESLMINHPHDCPVCDEGGECHLQDMTVMSGYNYRRYDFKKRTHNNQYLGENIHHEMNRCIQCYRCVRFYNDYANGKDFNVFGSANHVYFGRHKDGTLESEFSGNLVEVCPTGVFTDNIFRKQFTRKWDLTNTPSVCTQCSVGCNIIISERYGKLRRVMSRYNGDINRYFICDRARFGYEFVNADNRIKTPLVRLNRNSYLADNGNDAVINAVTNAIKGKNIIGIGSPKASLEANYALSKLVGQNFYHGLNKHQYKTIKTSIEILQNNAIHIPSLREIESADAILILGEDITKTAPMLSLAVQQSLRNKAVDAASKLNIPKWHDLAVRELQHDNITPLFIATPLATSLDESAKHIYRASVIDITSMAMDIAYDLNENNHSVNTPYQDIINALKDAKHPLIITGISSENFLLINACEDIVSTLVSLGKDAMFSIVYSECNSVGLGMIEGESLDSAIDYVNIHNVDTLIILENDLYKRADKKLIDDLYDKCKQVIVLDSNMNDTANKADILLPVATFAESQGTLVNNEGRAQRYYSAFPANELIMESWRWIRDLIHISDKNIGADWLRFDDVVASMCEDIPAFAKIKSHTPDADFRMKNEKIARQTIRFSGRTAMNANIDVCEPKPPEDTESPLAFTMEGHQGLTNATLIPFYWNAGWNSPQAINKYLDEPNGYIKDDVGGVILFDNKEEK